MKEDEVDEGELELPPSNSGTPKSSTFRHPTLSNKGSLFKPPGEKTTQSTFSEALAVHKRSSSSRRNTSSVDHSPNNAKQPRSRKGKRPDSISIGTPINFKKRAVNKNLELAK